VSKKLYVTNIPIVANESDVNGLFAAYGVVCGVRLVVRSWRSCCDLTAFIEMETDEQGAAAIAGFNGWRYGGGRLAVGWATHRHETDAEHSSLFGPMNMTADDLASDRLPAASRSPIPFVVRAPEARTPYILWKPILFSPIVPGQWGPFVPAASELAFQGIISEGAPIQKETLA